MVTIQSENKVSTPKIPEGLHTARLISIIELGTHPVEFQGATKNKFQLAFTFEFCEVLRSWKEGEPEKPAIKSVVYNVAGGELSNLYKVCNALHGSRTKGKRLDPENPYQPFEYLGDALQIEVSHKVSSLTGNKYAKLEGFSPVPVSPSTGKFRFEVPEQYNPSSYYDLDAHPEGWDSVPKWYQEKISESLEMKRKAGSFEHSSTEEVDELS